MAKEMTMNTTQAIQLRGRSQVQHWEVAAPTRYNNPVKQSHQPTRRRERIQPGFRPQKRAQAFLNLHARMTNLDQHVQTTVPAHTQRSHQK